jgi:ethanolamine-phosphate cytidylyltransferase
VIYVDGTFDLFHPGHLAFLEEAKKYGDYLIVGIHKDSDVNIAEGQYPIMNLQERVLNILSCRLVDNVVIGESYIVSEELIKHFNVSCVIHGETDFEEERYSVPIQKGIFLKIDSGSSLTTDDIVDRVVNNKELYEKGNAAKERKEVEMINAMTDSAEQ